MRQVGYEMKITMSYMLQVFQYVCGVFKAHLSKLIRKYYIRQWRYEPSSTGVRNGFVKPHERR
jgi:hypothetical protein